jgi:hypothetical protein
LLEPIIGFGASSDISVKVVAILYAVQWTGDGVYIFPASIATGAEDRPEIAAGLHVHV